MMRVPAPPASDVPGSEAAPQNRRDQAVRSVRVKSTVPGHSTLVDQAYNIFCDLQVSGAAVDPEEFCARYPAVQDSLIRLIRAHHFIEEKLELVDVEEVEDWPASGDTFAGFQLMRELGQGAFARVFLALEPALGQRQVVLKISRRGGAEAATLGRIAHPNIVPVFSLAEEEETGLTAVCMPYLGRATLHNILDHVYGDPAPAQKASAILEAIADSTCTEVATPARVLRTGSYVDGVRWLAIQLADGLAFIHAKGIYHRDLKPSNVLLQPNGTPMLLDFNLAADLENPHTRQGGTPLYMSPEHLRALTQPKPGASKKLGARSELFSLGVILYELLTGKHPFGPLPVKLKTRDLMLYLLKRQPQGFRPIRETRPDVDAALALVVEKCLDCNPEGRPESAADIARVLRRSQSFRARTSRWLLRHPKSVAAACLLVCAIGLAGAFYVSTRPPAHVVLDQQGKSAFEKRDYELAVYYFTESLRANPGQAEVRFARGKAYLALPGADKNYINLAMDDFYRADELAPSGPNKAYLGYCLHKSLQVESAIFMYEAALKLGIRTAEIQNNLAHLYLSQGKVAKAQEYLDEALRLNPKLQVAHYNQAILYYIKSLKAEADHLSADQRDFVIKGTTHFRQAAELGPMTCEMYLLGARLCASACSFDRAWLATTLDYLDQAINVGCNPQRLIGDSAFLPVNTEEGFRALLTRTPPATHPPLAAIRCVEPIKN